MAIKALETLIKHKDVKVIWLCSHQAMAAQVARTLEEIGDPILAQSIAVIDVHRHRQLVSLRQHPAAGRDDFRVAVRQLCEQPNFFSWIDISRRQLIQ